MGIVMGAFHLNLHLKHCVMNLTTSMHITVFYSILRNIYIYIYILIFGMYILRTIKITGIISVYVRQKEKYINTRPTLPVIHSYVVIR